MAEAAHPDVVKWDTFVVVLEDGTRKSFEHRPLRFNDSQLFRQYSVPIVGSMLAPIEGLIASVTNEALRYRSDFGFTESLVDSELKIDERLPLAVGVILASQERIGKNRVESAEKWAGIVSETMTREDLLAIFQKQLDIEKEVANLGKSLSTRLGSLRVLVGRDIDLLSLLQASMLRATSSSDPTGPTDTTSSSSAGTSTETPSTTTSRTPASPEAAPA